VQNIVRRQDLLLKLDACLRDDDQETARAGDLADSPCYHEGDWPMAQIKIYGIADRLNPVKAKLSDAIHACVMEALQFPADKRAHRFFPMSPADFYIPSGQGRTDHYTIIEISMFEGRSAEAKKQLIRLLFERIQAEAGIVPADVEITITETPRQNWGFRGQTGDEIRLNYKVEV
jgi:phenylpyruvate tautomerase PptA (4-oxalocrotonate tautomerase family)